MEDVGENQERFERFRAQFARSSPESAKGSVYSGWLIGFLDVDPAAQTAPGIGIEHPEHGPVEARWEPGVRYLICQIPEIEGHWARCVVDDVPLAVRMLDPRPLRPEAVLVTSPARYGDASPLPAVSAWAPGLDGVGPPLFDAGGGPVRWVLLDGYVYDVRDDLDEQPGRWSVSEWRPQTFPGTVGDRGTW